MHKVETTDAFVPKGGGGKVLPQPAVTIEAGARWLEAYDEVSVKNGRYLQGGGCITVGVANFLQGSGFGSFSKHYLWARLPEINPIFILLPFYLIL